MIDGAGLIGAEMGPAGIALSDNRRIPRLFKIVSGSNPYTANEVFLDESDGSRDLTGVYNVTAAQKLLWEVNGNTSVPADTIVEATPNPAGSGFWFSAGGGGSSALNTQNIDGTQVGTTADMRFDQAQGIDITQGGSGFDTVALRLATRTQRGTMGITGDGPSGLQKMSGRKLWQSSTLGIVVDADAVDHNGGGTELGFVYSDTTLTNLAWGVWGNLAGALARHYVNVHDTITTPGTYVDAAAVLSQAEIGATPYAYSTAGVYDAAGTVNTSVSIYARKTGVCGISFIGGAPSTPSVAFYYDLAATNLEIQSTSDLTFAASQGPIVRSPNGNRWRVVVDNAGVLSTVGPL